MACNTQSLKSGLTVLRCFQVLINLLFTGASAFAVFFVGKAYSDASKSGHWTNSSNLATAQELAEDNLTKGLVAVTVICALCLISYIFVLVLLVYTAVPKTRASARCCGNNSPYAHYTTDIIFDLFLPIFWGAMLGLMITGYTKLDWIQLEVMTLPEEGPWTETAKGLGLTGIFKDCKAPASTYSGYSSSPASSPSYSSYSSPYSSPSYSSKSGYVTSPSPSPSPSKSQVEDMPHVGRHQVVEAVVRVGPQIFIAAIAASSVMVLLFIVTTALDITMRSSLRSAATAMAASVKTADVEVGNVPPQQQHYGLPPPECYAKDGFKATAAASDEAFRHPGAYAGA